MVTRRVVRWYIVDEGTECGWRRKGAVAVKRKHGAVLYAYQAICEPYPERCASRRKKGHAAFVLEEILVFGNALRESRGIK